MGNVNRKASDEIEYVCRIIRQAFPEFEPVFGAHGDYGGHRAPRDHTISFRLRDRSGKFRSNVVWILPQELGRLTTDRVRALVDRSNGAKRKKRGK